MIDLKTFKKGHRYLFEIQDLAFGGKGIAKLQTESGDYVVFIPNTIPGQKVLARVIKKKRSHAEAKLLKVVELSPKEVEIPFQPIPGAPYATLPAEDQKQYKDQTARELFKRIAKVENIDEIVDEYITSPSTWNYRNKMEYSFSTIRYDLELEKEVKESFGLGFKHRGTWWAVENMNSDSGLFDAQFENLLKEIRLLLESSGLPAWNPRENHGFFRFLVVKKSFDQDQLLLNLITSSQGIDQFDRDAFVKLLVDNLGNRVAGILHSINDDLGDRTLAPDQERHLLHGTDHLKERVLDLDFKISIESFFQPNPKCAELLYKKAISYLMENNIISNEERVMDLFCGTGTIGQIVAKESGCEVIGVDIVDKAIDDAKKNAALNDVPNITFYASDAGKFISNYPQYQDRINSIILDPPRAGIAPKSLKKIINLNAPRIVYISCNPSTLARDTFELIESGFELQKISFVDQFPHTSHLECISLFIRKQTLHTMRSVQLLN